MTKLDRLARSVGDLLEIVARLERKKVSLRVLAMSGSQPLDTGTATGRLMLAVIGAVGQAEREAMLERQREGIAKAKAQGRYKGRVPKFIRLKEAGVRPSEIASRLGIGRASVYRVLADHTGENAHAMVVTPPQSLFDQRKAWMEGRAKHFGGSVVSRKRPLAARTAIC